MTNQSEIAEREKFEKFIQGRFRSIEKHLGSTKYRWTDVQLAWEAWERAIAESQAPQPEIDGRISPYCSDCGSEFACNCNEELGDGEPSPSCICEPPDYEGQSKLNGGWDKACPVHGETRNLQQELTDAKRAYGKLFNENAALQGRIDELESGAAQEVSPSANFVSEIRPRPDDPSCHVCLAQMVVKEWKCLCCKATTGVEEVSPPSPEPCEHERLDADGTCKCGWSVVTRSWEAPYSRGC